MLLWVCRLWGIEYLHHKKQQGENRVILSPQDIYNNMVYGENGVEEDAEEEVNDDDDDTKANIFLPTSFFSSYIYMGIDQITPV
jgi:hypothetical protein